MSLLQTGGIFPPKGLLELVHKNLIEMHSLLHRSYDRMMDRDCVTDEIEIAHDKVTGLIEEVVKEMGGAGDG